MSSSAHLTLDPGSVLVIPTDEAQIIAEECAAIFHAGEFAP